MTIKNINAFKDNYYSVAVQTPFTFLKKAQLCRILVGESFPASTLSPKVVLLRSNLAMLSEDGRVKLDFKIIDQGVYVQSVIAKESAKAEVRRETMLVIVPLKTFGIEKPFTISLHTMFL